MKIKCTFYSGKDSCGNELEACNVEDELERVCDCSTFGEEYSCVPSNQCLDPVLPDFVLPELSTFGVRQGNLGFSEFVDPTICNPFVVKSAVFEHPSWCEKPKQAKCPNTGETCCKTKIVVEPAAQPPQREEENLDPTTSPEPAAQPPPIKSKCGDHGEDFQCVALQV